MGLFDKIKKKSSAAADNNSIYKEIFSIICDNDPDTLKEIDDCIESSRHFALSHEELFDKRGIVPATASEFKVKWVGCTEIMISHGYVREFDENIGFEDFYAQFGELKIVAARGIMPNDDDIYLDYDFLSWIKCIDACWGKSGLCVGGIDISSESHVVFVCTIEQLDKLKGLAEEVGRRICKAAEI